MISYARRQLTEGIHSAMARAAYYRWNVMRKHVLPGCDPQTGKPLDRWNKQHVDEAGAAYKVMARVSIARAAALNAQRGNVLPG